MRKVLRRYTYVVMVRLTRSAACNGLHTVEQRMCRWLLTAHDRVESDDLMLTHEVLAGMIATHRSSVTIIIGTLQTAGLVRAHRGRITIVDRELLESASCERYQIIRDEIDRFLNS